MSVRRLVSMFESRAAARTATHAPAPISRTKVSALVQFYGASSTIASTSIGVIDAVRFAAFPNPHGSAAAAVESVVDPRWSIQLIDLARFAEFDYNYSGFNAPAADVEWDQGIATLDEPHLPDELQSDGRSHLVHAAAAALRGDRHHAPTDIDQSFAALEVVEDIDNATATATAVVADPVQDVEVKTYAQLLQEVNDLIGVIQDTDAAAAIGQPMPPQTQPQAQAAAPQVVKSRLFDFKQSPTFVRQCAQARRRRSAAAAKLHQPLWKL